MVFFNYSTMQMAAKVVFYGPGLCGKTTNLQYIYSQTSSECRGEMVSLETETDRTLFFDLLPIDVGQIAGFNTRIQLYTVPGQVFYNTTRKLVLKGVDGVVFVADSQRPMLQANLDSFHNLEENLAEMGIAIDEIPLVLQYNKRDLVDVCTLEELNQTLNKGSWPSFEASAIRGEGVFETLKGISKLTLVSLKKRLMEGRDSGSFATPVIKPSAPVAAAPTETAKAAKAEEPAPPAAASKPESTSVPAPTKAAEAPPATTASPAKKESTASRLASARATAASSPRRGTRDVLSELETIRRRSLRVAQPMRATKNASSRSDTNGHGELRRDIQMTLKKGDFARARRFTITLQVEDEGREVVESIRDFHIDLASTEDLHKVLLQLNIALAAKD